MTTITTNAANDDFGKPEAIHTLETMPPPDPDSRVDELLPPIEERQTQPDLEDDVNSDVIRHGLAHLVTSGALEDLSRALAPVSMNRARRTEVIRCFFRLQGVSLATARCCDEVVTILRGRV